MVLDISKNLVMYSYLILFNYYNPSQLTIALTYATCVTKDSLVTCVNMMLLDFYNPIVKPHNDSS